MKISIFLCLFLSTLCSTTHAYIRNIEFNMKYPVAYYGGTISAGTDIYLRMKILENDKMQVSIETYSNYIHTFAVSFSFFDEYPSDYDIMQDKYYGNEIAYEETEIIEGGISTYAYPFDTPEDKKYLGIRIRVYNILDYLDLTVIKSSDKAVSTESSQIKLTRLLKFLHIFYLSLIILT